VTVRKTKQKQLAALVVTHERVDELRLAVTRLLDAAPEVLQHVVVVNNGKCEETQRWLASIDDSRLKTIKTDRNLGGAGGFETGMRYLSTHHDPDWIVVMDDDGRPEAGTLEAFQSLETDGWDAVAAAVFLPDGGICSMNTPALNPFWHRAKLRQAAGSVLRGLLTLGLSGGLQEARESFHLADEAYSEAGICSVDTASFVGLFISRAAIEKAGFPDGRMFLYGDDLLYALTLRKAGGTIGFCPYLRFVHAFRSIAPGEHRFRPVWKTYYYHRNLLISYRLAAGWLFPFALLLIFPKWLSKIKGHRNQEAVFLRLMMRAFRDGLLRRLDVPHERVLTWAGKTADLEIGKDRRQAAVPPPAQ